MKILLLLSLLFLSSCGKNEDLLYKKYNSASVQEEFKPFLNEFIEKYGNEDLLRKYKLSITLLEDEQFYSEVPNSYFYTTGACLFLKNSNVRPILIKKSSWESYNPAERELLIFHEIGHCLLDKIHNDNLILADDLLEYKESLMSTYSMGFRSYLTRRDYYISELIGGNIPFDPSLYYQESNSLVNFVLDNYPDYDSPIIIVASSKTKHSDEVLSFCSNH